MQQLAIQTRALRKVFDKKVAVRSLTLDVSRGEVFGFLGPNGAGKTTCMKILLGLTAPTAGEAFVLGSRAGDVVARRKIGFLPENFRFYDWLTATELLEFHGRLHSMSWEQLRRRVPELLELVGLTAHRDQRLHGFSKGMLQRIGLAQSLLNEPELIFLDEPTSGLDPVGRRLVRDVIKEQKNRGVTVFLNSHLLSEVEITCDRVAFIKHGEVLETRELQDRTGDELHVSVRARGVHNGCLPGLVSWASAVCLDGERVRFTVRSPDAVPEIVRYLVAQGADIYDVVPERASLEDLFLQIVGTDGGL